ncbi:MAG: hypothetical protein NT034_01500, partial [Candidatus Magasanikbacteria bacterium]|nr:hypothetical protein [Candidatus Magasanikbacteria bacterium]
MNEEIKETFPTSIRSRRWLKMTGLFFLALLIVFGAVSGAAAAYLKLYQNKVYPGVYAGHYHLGNMTRADLSNFIETTNNRLSKEGINLDVTVGDKKTALRLSTISNDSNAAELVKLDSYAMWQNAYAVGRTGNAVQRLFGPMYYRLLNT